MQINRREFLTAAAAGGAVSVVGDLAWLGRAWAQSGEPLRVGVLTPLTGGGAVYGTAMSKIYAALADEINKSTAAGAAGHRRQADPALRGGQPDESRRRRARRTEAGRREQGARDHRHVVERGDPSRRADHRAGEGPAVLRVELARHLDVQGRRFPVPHGHVAGVLERRVLPGGQEAQREDRRHHDPEQPVRARASATRSPSASRRRAAR